MTTRDDVSAAKRRAELRVLRVMPLSAVLAAVYLLLTWEPAEGLLAIMVAELASAELERRESGR